MQVWGVLGGQGDCKWTIWGGRFCISRPFTSRCVFPGTELEVTWSVSIYLLQTWEHSSTGESEKNIPWL